MLQILWKRRPRERGFTLIELLIVVAIIAILAAILIPNFLRARAQSQVSASKGNIRNIATALESYFVDNNIYPTELSSLTTTYMRTIPDEPCSGEASSDTQGYGGGYTTSGSPSGTDYKISVDFTGTPCANIVPGLSYTPGGGLDETP